MSQKAPASKGAGFSLIVRSSDEQVVNGTYCPGDLDRAKRLAKQLLLLLSGAGMVEIYCYDPATHYSQMQALALVTLDDPEQEKQENGP